MLAILSKVINASKVSHTYWKKRVWFGLWVKFLWSEQIKLQKFWPAKISRHTVLET